ncbi:MAG: hypothetical protein MK110_16360 [Fuerstiella sp.]|nr:hypothetical protein [Fuerstiella sp.]
MSSRTSNVFVAGLSATAGVAITLVVASQLVQSDAGLSAAQRRFANLEYSEAHRIQATFERLQNRPEERQQIMAVHHAVTDDEDLDRRLKLLYLWWETRDDAQRQELRTLSPNEWLKETQHQLSDTSPPDSFLVRVAGPRGSIRVSRKQVDQFLQHALPVEGIPNDDQKLLDSVDVGDRSLAKVLIIAKGLVRRTSGNPRLSPNEDALVRTYNAVTADLFDDRLPPRPADLRRQALICVSVLRSVADYLSVDFYRRNSVGPEAIEKEFADLDTPDRIRHMMMAPEVATYSIQVRLKSQDRNTPVGQLAARLAAFDRIGNQLRDKYRRGAVREGGRPRPVRPRDGDARQIRNRGPGNDRIIKRRGGQ